VGSITNTPGERREPIGWISRRHTAGHLCCKKEPAAERRG
jgi:hypothetical protein